MTASTLYLPNSAQAQYATPRNLELPTLGPLVDRTMAALGWPPMPWQSQVNAVAGEMLPDGTFRYPTVVVTTPRQAGKTTMLGGKNIQRCMMWKDYRSWYTAQTGLAARDVWYEWETALRNRMPGRWDFRRSAGQETAKFRGTGSWLRAFPPTPESLHSKQSDSVDADELWNASIESGNALMQAVVPTQATRPRRQLWLISTAGDENSIWWRNRIEQARMSIGDPDSNIAFFDWHAPEEAEWDSPETWAAYHPAFGITIDERAVRDAIDQLGEAEFRRAYLNQWPKVETSWRAGWPGLASEERIPDRARVYLAADAAWNHRSATITAAAALPDGRIAIEVIDQRGGIDWLLPRLLEITRRHRAAVAIQRTGPIGFLVEELQRAGVNTVSVSNQDYADSAARFRTMVSAGMLSHNDDPRMNMAVENAISRETGDRSVWRRKDSSIDISPIVAASMSIWQAATPAIKPKVRGE